MLKTLRFQTKRASVVLSLDMEGPSDDVDSLLNTLGEIVAGNMPEGEEPPDYSRVTDPSERLSLYLGALTELSCGRSLADTATVKAAEPAPPAKKAVELLERKDGVKSGQTIKLEPKLKLKVEESLPEESGDEDEDEDEGQPPPRPKAHQEKKVEKPLSKEERKALRRAEKRSQRVDEDDD